MNSLLIESNRDIANSLKDDNLETNLNIVDNRHETLNNTARWSTIIESGLELLPGDQISMESCALNIKGAGSDNFMTFTGNTGTQLTDGSFKTDNKSKIKVAYYVSNNIQSNVPLPLGSTTITDPRTKFNDDFGMVDLTGKNIWGVNFISQNYPPKPATLPSYFGYTAFNDGWSLNKNGFFFDGIALEDGSNMVVPNYPLGVENLGKATMMKIMGYMGWNQNVPIYGLTGTTFGQNNTDVDSTYNFNIENKDKTEFRVDQPVNTTPTPPVEFKQGGASPYYVLNKGIINNNTLASSFSGVEFGNNSIYYASHRNTIKNTFPGSLGNFVAPAGIYDDLCALNPTTFKGTYCNYKPNTTRLYCTDYTDLDKTNFGPFYSSSYNTLVKGLPSSSDIDLRTTGRDRHYFHLLEQEIELDLGKGNLAPNRVAQIITDQMKERQPDMADPQNSVGIGAEIYLTFPNNVGANSQEVPLNPDYYEVLREKIAQISSKTYFNYPTMAGLCWNSKYKYQDSTDPEGWKVCEVEQSQETGIPATRKMTGDDYSRSQAYNKYYKIMLTGNPYEWETVCRIHPMLQIAPFVAPQIGPAFDYGLHSILAGFDAGFNEVRIAPDGTIVNYKVGNLGCFPCILSDGLRMGISEEDFAFKAMWYEGTGYATHTQIGGSNPNNYDIKHLRCSQTCVYDLPKKRELLDLEEYNIIPTNIIFNGQVQLSVWNEQYEKIRRHMETPGIDTLKSQSDSFFNSTYVDWIVGRIDDMYSYPENKSSNDFGIFPTGSLNTQLPPTPLRDGTPVFLPNIYQTYKLYNGNPQNGGSPTADTLTNSAEIKDILVHFTKPIGADQVSGSYMMRNMRVGYANADYNNYTVDEHPQSLYNVGNSPPNTWDPTGGGHDSKYFGLPCYSTYGKDFIQNDDDYKTAYEKGCRRTIECFRYLPQGSTYNFRNAYNRTIDLGTTYLNDNFTTRPDSFSLQQIKDLWDKITELNNGKGIGMIPIFYKILPAGVTNTYLLEVPFLAVIVKNQPNKNMPYPRMGEYFMLGSTPSLSQNNLSFPATTQQSNIQINSNESPIAENIDVRNQYITNFCGIQNYRSCINDPPSDDDVRKIDLTRRTPLNLKQNELILANGGKQLANGIMVGANDPVCSYDTTFNRFSFGNLHTELFKGNGVFQLGSFGPNTNPEEIERVLNAETASFSQQVQLPCGYFQKIDDNIVSWELFNGPYDKYIPGRLLAGDFGLTPIQIQSIEGNIIAQTFSDKTLGPGIDENNTAEETGNLTDNNFEPAGMSMYFRDRNPSNGHSVFVGNCLYMAPYNGTQYKLRLLDTKTALTEFTQVTYLYPPSLRPYAYVRGDNKPYLFASAQGGVGITGLSIPKSNGVDLVLGPVDYSLFEGSMFSKLGFSLNQFKPIFSQVQTKFNHTLFNKYLGKDKSAYKAYQNMISPVTTNSVNTTSAMPGSVNGFGTPSEDADKSVPNIAIPMYNLGQGLISSAQTSTSDFIIAENLPTKLSFPYLVLRSNISTPCVSQYMGGPNGSQLLPAVSYLMTNYASDDYFYNYRSDLVFKVDRPYVLTELISSIHLPNGQLASDILGETSAVIYRIDFVPREQPVEQK